MTTINYSYKFNPSESPELDDFTLGFLFASHSDLENLPEFEKTSVKNEDISYLSIMLIRDNCLHIQEQISPIIKELKDTKFDISYLGVDYWQYINKKDCYYLKKLPHNVYKIITDEFDKYGQPCSLIKDNNNNFIFSYNDQSIQQAKEQELLKTYSKLASFSSKIKP